jgi:hypothetical protein
MKGSREYPASKRHTSGAPPRAEVLHPMWLMAHRYEHVDQSATHIAQWRRDGPSPQSRRDVERAIGYGYGVLFSRRHGLSYPLDIVCDAFEGVSRRWDAERTPREPSNSGGLDSDALTMQTLSGDSPAPPALTHVLPAQV